MITADIHGKGNNGYRLSLCGHAGYADKGKDIVCASATILAYTAAENLRRMYLSGRLKKPPNIRMREGDIFIQCIPEEDEIQMTDDVFRIICAGYELLARDYPEFVAVKSAETGESRLT